MIPVLNRVRLDVAATLILETGWTMEWAPDGATHLTDLKGWTGSTGIRRDGAARLGAHGSHSERGWKDDRLISAYGHHTAASRRDAAIYARDLAGFLGDGTEGTLKVDDVDLGPMSAEVYLTGDGVDLDGWKGGRDVPFTIHMVATDPRKYGTAILSPSIGVPVIGGGLFTEPLFKSDDGLTDGFLNFGDPGETGKVSLTNEGSADTGPVFTVTGDYVPGFIITERSTGRRIVFSGTILTGQTLVIDSNTGAAMLDGYASRSTQLVVSEWVRLGPGQTAEWLFESAGSTNASLQVKVTPAWW